MIMKFFKKTTTSILNFHYQVITCTIERALLKTPVIGQTAFDYAFIWYFLFVIICCCCCFFASFFKLILMDLCSDPFKTGDKSFYYLKHFIS